MLSPRPRPRCSVSTEDWAGFHLKCKAFRCARELSKHMHIYVYVCVGVYPGLGQLCTINKVIHLPQKLFENLQPRLSSTAGTDLTPIRTAASSPASTQSLLPASSLTCLPTGVYFDFSNCLHCNENVFALGNIYACAGRAPMIFAYLCNLSAVSWLSVCVCVCSLIPACFQVLNSRIQSNGLTSTMTYLPQTDSELITLACWASNVVGRQTAPCLVHILPASKYTPTTSPFTPFTPYGNSFDLVCNLSKTPPLCVLPSCWCRCWSKSHLLCTPQDLLT